MVVPFRYEVRAYERKTSSSPPSTLLRPYPPIIFPPLFSSLSLSLSLHLSLQFADVKVEQYFRSASICASSLHFCFFSSFVFWSRLCHHSFLFTLSCETTLLIASLIAHSHPYPLLFTGTSQDDGIVRQDNQFYLY